MATSDRKYAKQNLDRCANNIENAAKCAIDCGQAFIQSSDTLIAQGAEIPEEYIRIINDVDLVVNALDLIKNTVVSLRDSF